MRHGRRMEGERKAKLVFEMRVERGFGRRSSRITWEDTIKAGTETWKGSGKNEEDKR